MTNVIKDAVDRWGYAAQLGVLQEECAELIAAVSHIRRGREGAMRELIEELVDAHIMIHQIEAYLDANGFPAELATVWDNKLDKLKQRLKNEKDL